MSWRENRFVALILIKPIKKSVVLTDCMSLGNKWGCVAARDTGSSVTAKQIFKPGYFII